jgi:C-terminal processing protease CtpA/Prc
MYRLSTLLFTTVLMSFILPGCATSMNRWEGSVDAVFRYRTAENSTIVEEIKPESFSEAAGLKSGDLLLAVDGKDVTTAAFLEVRSALRGPVGTTVTLTVKRGENVMDIPVERRPISKK